MKKTTEELRRSNSDLESFASIVSHDLKGPLNYITTSADILKADYAGSMDEAGMELLNIISGSSAKMKAMLESLRAFSKIGNNNESLEDVSMSLIIDEAVREMEPYIEESGAKVNYENLPDITANRDLMIQLFQNLIGNAIKYRKDGHAPEIDVEAEKKGDEWIFSVADNGIGIDPEFRDKVFMIFQRLHPEEKYSGYGVGLSFCQRIVNFHGGDIWLDTEYTQGARFYFSLSAS